MTVTCLSEPALTKREILEASLIKADKAAEEDGYFEAYHILAETIEEVLVVSNPNQLSLGL